MNGILLLVNTIIMANSINQPMIVLTITIMANDGYGY